MLKSVYENVYKSKCENVYKSEYEKSAVNG